MKTPYSLVQKILIATSTVVLTLCIVGDAIALLSKFQSDIDWLFMVNLVLSFIAICVFTYFILKPEKTGVASNLKPENASLILSATRTYTCIIYFDVAIIMALVLFGSINIPYVELGLIALAIIVFIIGAVKYLYDSRAINSALEAEMDSKLNLELGVNHDSKALQDNSNNILEKNTTEIIDDNKLEKSKIGEDNANEALGKSKVNTSRASKKLEISKEEIDKAIKKLERTKEDSDKSSKRQEKAEKETDKANENLDKSNFNTGKASKKLEISKEDIDKAVKKLEESKEYADKANLALKKSEINKDKTNENLGKSKVNADKSNKKLEISKEEIDKANQKLEKSKDDKDNVDKTN